MPAQINATEAYTDLSSLNAIKSLGRSDTAAGLKQVARQFEAVFLKMMLKSMRNSGKVFAEGNYLNSNEMEFYQQNYDDQLSLHLAKGKGLGLADMLYRQMVQQYRVEERTAANLRTGEAQTTQFTSPREFIATLMPLAERAAAKLGADPKVLLAQSALETGWGSKIARDSRGANSHNLFGIKSGSGWQGPVARTTTLEFVDGLPQRQKASFRRYETYEQSFDDYINLLQANPRYEAAMQKAGDARQFTLELQSAGYATDPDYGNKVTRVMQSPIMQTALAAHAAGD